MPQDNTRPRIVPDVNPYTPPFNPNAGSGVDPMELIRQLLTPQAPVVQQPTVMDKIGSIINAIGQGVAVGISPNPGQVLQQQLQGRQQQAFELKQQADQRQQRLEEINRQFGLQTINRQLDEASDIRKEERQQKYKVSDRQAAFDDYIKKNDIDFKQDLTKQDKQIEAHKAAAIIEHQWNVEKEKGVNERFDKTQTRLENKEKFDKKIALISAGIPAGLANSIGSKLFDGEDLTPEENKVLTATAQKNIAMAAKAARAGSGRGGSALTEGLSDRQANQYIQARMKDDFIVVKNPDGSLSTVEKSNATRDSITGEIAGFQRIATQGEKMVKLAEEANAVEALKTPQGRSILLTKGEGKVNYPTDKFPSNVAGPPADIPIQGGEQQLVVTQLMSQARQSLQGGFSMQQTINGLQNYKKEHPEHSEYVDSVIVALRIPKSTVGKRRK